LLENKLQDATKLRVIEGVDALAISLMQLERGKLSKVAALQAIADEATKKKIFLQERFLIECQLNHQSNMD